MPLSIRRFLNTVRAKARRAPGVSLVVRPPSAGVAADADRLIARFRDQAYFEARERASGRCIDGAGSFRHWTRVKLEIAKRHSIAIGLSGADRRA